MVTVVTIFWEGEIKSHEMGKKKTKKNHSRKLCPTQHSSVQSTSVQNIKINTPRHNYDLTGFKWLFMELQVEQRAYCFENVQIPEEARVRLSHEQSFSPYEKGKALNLHPLPFVHSNGQNPNGLQGRQANPPFCRYPGVHCNHQHL